MLSAVPQAPPSNVSAVGMSDSMLRLEWTTPISCLTYGGSILGYTIKYSTNNISNFITLGFFLSHHLTDLMSATEYRIQVAANTEEGVGKFSEEIKTTTLQGEDHSQCIAPGLHLLPQDCMCCPRLHVLPQTACVAPRLHVLPQTACVAPRLHVLPQNCICFPSTTSVAPELHVLPQDCMHFPRTACVAIDCMHFPRTACVAPDCMHFPSTACVTLMTSYKQ